jgi:3-dehydroquinate dehydratase/shikimate dehydrogenase
MEIIKTKRLILRRWKDEDLEPFVRLNADPRVMEFFPSVMSREMTVQMLNRIQTKFDEMGWGLWAVSLTGAADFIGFIGLNRVDFSSHFTPAVEIGWRLGFEYWGSGYAPEGAKAVLHFAFNELNLPEIVSFTAAQNMRSRSVMEKIGMRHDSKEDFDHPNLPEGHPLRRHVLYRTRGELPKQDHP